MCGSAKPSLQVGYFDVIICTVYDLFIAREKIACQDKLGKRFQLVELLPFLSCRKTGHVG